MLNPVTAIRFEKAMGSGRTRPAILTCEAPDGAEVELVRTLAVQRMLDYIHLLQENVNVAIGYLRRSLR